MSYAARLDCAIACRNYAEASGLYLQGQKPTGIPADDLLARMDSDGAINHVLYKVMEVMDKSFPSCTTIIAMVEDTLLKHPNIRLAVFDHITSPTALVLPVIELCALCKRKNVTVLIDGAPSNNI